ncbi:branched-chain amino acid ABC transporter permease [Variovorax sp. PBL-H6]|uniref:branched-chain amino acid ABC transporter permease n=1 Tax=Variovorax sp. PBL-H6 TaxID=434009 RepID=UPI0013A553F2|nr:branched-chain amino acid ABC transporter permease [Variovorax sp. PBL-H6]
MTRAGVLLALIWLLMISAPLWPGVDLNRLTQLLCYGLFAVSLAFAWNQAGLLCFGHALFFGVGAYLAASVSKGMLPGLPSSPWLGLLLATAGGAAAAGLLGLSLFIGRVVKGAFFGIVTLCAGVIAERVATNWNAIGGFNGLLDIPPPSLWDGLDMLDPQRGYWIVLTIVALMTALLGWLAASPWGTVLRSIGADETRAATFGYPVARHKVSAFALAGAVAGLAGGLFAGQFGFVAPSTLGFGLSTEVLIWVAIGGRQSLTAALLGAIWLKYLESFLSDTLGEYWLLVLGLVLVAVVMYLPRGLLGGLLSDALPRRLRMIK